MRLVYIYGPFESAPDIELPAVFRILAEVLAHVNQLIRDITQPACLLFVCRAGENQNSCSSFPLSFSLTRSLRISKLVKFISYVNRGFHYYERVPGSRIIPTIQLMIFKLSSWFGVQPLLCHPHPIHLYRIRCTITCMWRLSQRCHNRYRCSKYMLGFVVRWKCILEYYIWT